MRVALALNDLVARDRSEGIPDPDSAPARRHHRLQGRGAAPESARRPRTRHGGAVWHDYQMANADRVTFSFALSAAAGGATTANYVAAESFLVEGQRVTGARVSDMRGGDRFDVRAVGRRECGRRLGAGARRLAPRACGRRAGTAALARDERRGPPAGPEPRLRRRGRRPLPVPGPVADGVHPRHEPRRARGAASALERSAADLEAFLAEGRARFPAPPGDGRRPAGASGPAADGVRATAAT